MCVKLYYGLNSEEKFHLQKLIKKQKQNFDTLAIKRY